MTYETLKLILIITVSFFGLLLIAGISIVIFLYGRLSVRNNPDNCAVFINAGDKLNEPVKGKIFRRSNLGTAYKYGKHYVLQPKRFREVYHKGRVAIFLHHIGQIVASPFPASDDRELTPTEKESLINDIFESHYGKDAINAISGTKINPKIFIIILIGVAVIGVGVFAVNYFRQNQPTQQTPATQQTPLPPSQYKIEQGEIK